MGVETTASPKPNVLSERYSVDYSIEDDIQAQVFNYAESFKELAQLLKDELPESRELSLAQTHLETAFLYARRCVELNQDVL